MGSNRTVVIAGAGAAGLFAAWHLLRRGLRPVVVEAGGEAGGLLGSVRIGPGDLELYYHHLFTSDRLVPALLATLGIPLDFRVTRTAFVDGEGRRGELSGPQQLASFGLLTPAERAQVALLLVRAMGEWTLRRGRVESLDDVPVERWARAWGGDVAWERFLRPMVEKKFGRDTPEISAAWMLGRLGMRAGRTHRGEILGYPRGGFARLVEGLVAAIRRGGGELHLGTSAEKLVLREGRVRGLATSRGVLEGDAVISTLPPRAQATVLGATGLPDEAARFTRLPYQGTLTVLLGLERPLGDVYWTNVLDPAAPFGAVIEHTVFRPVEDYGGPALYLASYPDPDSPLWSLSDAEVVAEFASHLARLLPGARANPIRWSKVVRTDGASLVYRCGVRGLLPPRRAAVEGLRYTGMFRCYPKRPLEHVAADAFACVDELADAA